MRTIKFRGRDIDTGKFVSAELGQVSAEINDEYLTFITDDVHLVDADSIAQLVGFDLAGNEVYEGDFLIDELEQEYTAEIYDRPEKIHALKLKEAQP